MKRKHLYIVAIFFLVSNLLRAQSPQELPTPLIPRPVDYQQGKGAFNINAATAIYYVQETLRPAAELLKDYLLIHQLQPILTWGKQTAGGANAITLQIDSVAIPQQEGYSLQVTSSQVLLTGHDAAGIIHGIQSLRQLWSSTTANKLSIDACVITDYPRFAYRSMALDVSRHFFSVSFIKKYLDLLSLYKLNTFHWHLTDDQGWRIEIKQYPRLQTKAAWRRQTLIGHKKETPHRFDGRPYGGYYTQHEIKEVVRYATQRGITIIPEIEMPGHALAALSAYPYLGCTGGPYETATFWGVFDDVFCAGNDSTFVFLQQVLEEVIQLFPSQYIHIGGDECPKTRWKTCAKCQQRMKELALSDEHALQSWFVQRIEKYLNSKGRDIIGWDEILEGGLAPNATVMSWRGEEGGLTAAQQKHRVIMTPESHVYFDYYLSRNPAEPVAAGHYTPLSKVYSYQPAVSLPDSLSSYIAGVEGQAWSEYMVNEKQAAYMIFPRALALAELAWTPQALRNYDHFLERLRQQTSLLKALKVPYAANFDEVVCTGIRPQKDMVELSLASSLPKVQIRYTTNGSIPTLNSALYTAPILMKKSGTVKALAFDSRRQPVGRVYAQPVNLHKAIGAAVTLTNEPMARWNPGKAILVNGIAGIHRYNDAQWLGFNGDNLEVVIDLGTAQTISTVQMNFLNYHWQRVWAPLALDILVSDDGSHYNHVFSQKDFPINGINKVRAAIQPVKARYVKVVGINKGLLPEGEYGAGTKALLMIDEILID